MWLDFSFLPHNSLKYVLFFHIKYKAILIYIIIIISFKYLILHNTGR